MQKAYYWYLVVWAIESVLTFMATAKRGDIDADLV